MSIKYAIFLKLSALAITTKIWDAHLPQNPTYPTTVYDLIDEVPIGRSHDSNTAPFREARVQIDVFAQSGSQADDLIEQYFTALNSFDGVIADSLSPQTSYDVSIRYESTNPIMDFPAEPTLNIIRGRSMDFMIFYK